MKSVTVHSERQSDRFQSNSLDNSRERCRVHITVYVLRIENGACRIDAGSFQVTLPARHSEKARELGDRPVVFGIRPEDIYDKALSLVEATDENIVESNVDVIEPMGSSVVLYLAIGDHSLVASVDADTKAKDMEPLTVVFDAEKSHLFDKETGAAIF